METIDEIIVEQLEDGSTLTFIPNGMGSKNDLDIDDVEEVTRIVEPIFDDQGNRIGTKLIATFKI